MMALPLQGEEEIPLSLRLETETAGFVYGLYSDRECELPFLNDDDTPVILESDEDGSLTSVQNMSQESVYIRQISSITGYHVDPQVYCLDRTLHTLPVYPIEVSVDTGEMETGTYRILDEQEEIVLEWSLEDCDNPCIEDIGSLLDAGSTYLLKRMDEDEWAIHKELPFTIPLHPQKTELKVPVMIYGRLNVNWVKPLPENGLFGLFMDEESEHPVNDVFGHPVIMDVQNETEWSFPLLQGNYVLREMECDEHCVDTPIQEVEITEKQNTDIRLNKEFLRTMVSLCNEDGRLLEGTILVEDEEGNQETMQSGQEIILRKNTSYRLIPTGVASGYYIPDMVTLHSTEQVPDPAVIQANPFQITFFNRDQTTGAVLSGGEFVIEDLNGSQIAIIHGNTEGTVLPDLTCGMTYRIHQVRKIDMYLPMQDVIFAIPERGEQNWNVEGNSVGYVGLMSSVYDNNGNVITEAGFKVWMDENCTIPAVDIQGMQIQGTGTLQAEVVDGTYYVSVTSMPQAYYRIMETGRIDCAHAQSVHVNVPFHTAKADFFVTVQEEEGNMPEDFTIVVKKEGRHIGTLKNDGTSSCEQGLQVLAGGTYSLALKGDETHYIFETEEKTMEVPLYMPQDVPATVYKAVPYVSFTVMNPDAQGQAAYDLFTDRECTRKAVSVKETKDSNTWNLHDGTYYLRQTSIHPSWYENDEIQQIDLNHHRSWKESRVMRNMPVTVQLSCVDEDGITVHGAMYEIQDGDLNTLETIVIGNDTVTLQGTWLHRGNSYTVHQIRSADGYDTSPDIVFTVPQKTPSTTPNITLPQAKKSLVTLKPNYEKTSEKENPKLVEKQDKKEENRSDAENDHWIITGAGIGALVLCSGIILLKKFTRRNMKNFIDSSQ